MSRKLILFAAAMSLMLILVCAAGAQTASIAGIVVDSSGAVVQGAEITVRNTATDESARRLSGGTRLLRVTNLPVGKYQIK